MRQESPDIDVFINNNPKAECVIENIFKNEKWNLKNTPFVIVKGYNFNNSKTFIKLIYKKKIISERKISIFNNQFNEKFELESLLENQGEITVKIGKSFIKRIPFKLNRIYGKVTYFDGTPVSKPIIITDKMMAIGEKNGNFEIFLNKRENYIGILDKNYSKTTLESWLYDINLNRNLKLNIKLGKLEVYEIGAWKGTMAMYIHFIPMSLTRSLKFIKTKENKKCFLNDPRIWPILRKNDVKVFINEKKVSLSTFDKYNDFIGGYTGNKNDTRPGYILGISNKNWKDGIIRIEIKHKFRLGKKEILEKGEGYYLGFLR